MQQESRTRLLISVCLLSSYDPSRSSPNGTSSSSPGSVSPKSRRSSLPAGPTSQYANSGSSLRTHNSIHEFTNSKERRNSQTKSPSENGSHKNDVNSVKEETTDSNDSKEKLAEESPTDKDSSELNLSPPSSSHVDPVSNTASSFQESTCDNDIEDICLLPEISIPVKPKPLYYLNLVQWASLQRIWRWDNATLILHARYALSIMLATAAMLTFVLTFVPNQVLAYGTKDSTKQ